jgi:ABC-type bacteriocin/lantibiotic exporter with double-glycine peptidase domain
MLFSGTIVENISLFEDNPDIRKIEEILTGLDMMEFIKSLPNYINTDIGSLASKISGGQKQRLAIARALYKNPEILILDESTSQLDEETESNVISFIKANMKGKTIICVAHRRGAIEKAEEILSI